MDWSKSKSILIIAFIITNLILGYVLIQNRSMEETFNNKFIANVKEKLSQKNIQLSDSTVIPLETPSLPKLTIEYDIYNPEKTVELFFESYSKSNIINGYIFRSEDNTLSLKKNNKKLIYINRSNDKKYEDLNEERLKKIVEEFLTEKGFRTDDYKLGSYDYLIDEKIHKLEYVKVYKNRFVETTYMVFHIDNTGVKKFTRFWVDINEEAGRDISISSAPNALLRLLSNQEVSGKTITDISLCYYFDPNYESERHDEIFDPDSTSTGQATPVWRIKFEDGTTKFLEE